MLTMLVYLFTVFVCLLKLRSFFFWYLLLQFHLAFLAGPQEHGCLLQGQCSPTLPPGVYTTLRLFPTYTMFQCYWPVKTSSICPPSPRETTNVYIHSNPPYPAGTSSSPTPAQPQPPPARRPVSFPGPGEPAGVHGPPRAPMDVPEAHQHQQAHGAPESFL